MSAQASPILEGGDPYVYASRDRERQDRRMVNGEIAVVNAEIGIVNAKIAVCERRDRGA
jgi:hypothetical protein